MRLGSSLRSWGPGRAKSIRRTADEGWVDRLSASDGIGQRSHGVTESRRSEEEKKREVEDRRQRLASAPARPSSPSAIFQPLSPPALSLLRVSVTPWSN